MKNSRSNGRGFLKRMLVVLAVLSLAACASIKTFAPFATDGCSLFPDRSIFGKADWCDCCLAHDLAYWRGGTEADRLNADRELRSCVEKKTKDHVLAQTMYVGVRAAGGPILNTPFRWGYGWSFGREYQALTDDELASVKILEDAYRAKNPKLLCQNDPAVSNQEGSISYNKVQSGEQGHLECFVAPSRNQPARFSDQKTN